MSRSASVREQGLTEERISQLDDYRNGDFSDREKLALELTEFFSVAPEDATDELFDRLNACFTEKEIVELAGALTTLHGAHRWNVVVDRGPANPDGLTYTGLPGVPAAQTR